MSLRITQMRLARMAGYDTHGNTAVVQEIETRDGRKGQPGTLQPPLFLNISPDVF